MEDNKFKQRVAPPMVDPWHRKATAKDTIIICFSVIYMFAILFTYDYYSHDVSFAMTGLFILFGITIYFITPKDKRRILRDFSKDGTDDLLFHIRRLYLMGSVGAVCIALVLGTFLGALLAKSKTYPKAADLFALTAMVVFLAAFMYGPYLLLVKKLLPQLKERYNSEITNEKDTEHPARSDRE